MKKRELDKNELYELYINQGLSMRNISLLKKCSETCVKGNLTRYNIPIKTCSDYIKQTISKKDLYKEYITNNTPMKEIVKKYNTSVTNILTLIKKYNIPKRKSHNFKKGKNNPRWKGGKYIPASFIYDYKHGAKRRGLEFSVDITYLETLLENQNHKCSISNMDISLPSKRSTYKSSTASLDRIDNSKGYIIGNVQWVHKIVQQMKWISDQKQFIDWCKQIAKNN
jgi:predicted DNA-binding protein YlxM (UPF0122 family)